LLSLVLALVAFLGTSKANEYADNKAAMESSLNAEQKLSQANSIRSEILKALIGGFGNSVAEVPTQIGQLKSLAASGGLEANQKAQIQAVLDDVELIKAAYDKDMLSNAGTGDGEQAQDFTWRTLVENLSIVLAKKHGEYNTKVQQAMLAEQDAEAKIAAKQTEVDQMKNKVTTLEADLADEKKSAAEKQKNLEESLQQSVVQLRDANTSLEDYKATSQDQLASLQANVNQVSQQNELLKNKINIYEKEVFDIPDGRIVQVASSLNTVFLDLGRADGLTANRSFAIYDQSVTNFEKGQHKAMIEVIRVGENQAEAKVTSEDPTDPILTGDYVLTAVWDPGYSTPIALAGFFDLDSDGYSDLDKLIQLIKRNGGEVVAYHDDEGNLIGEIDSSVRYLVLGEAPNVGTNANPAVVRAMEKMEGIAEENTVQTINLQKLLNRMGIRSKPKMEKIDSRSGEFQPRSPADTLKSSDR
jgi:hypothetical protein